MTWQNSPPLRNRGWGILHLGHKPKILTSLIGVWAGTNVRWTLSNTAGDCHGSDATKCLEGESPLGSGWISWRYVFVPAVDIRKLPR
jgi:hypothetical protein